MEEDRSRLFPAAARLGLVFGAYWSVVCIAKMLGFMYFALTLLYAVLWILLPVVSYRITRRYRNCVSRSGQGFSFMHGWHFGTMLYLFGSIIEAVPEYFFHARVYPKALPGILEMIKPTIMHTAPRFWDIYRQALEAPLQTAPMKLVLNGIFNAVFWGIVISAITALILRRRPGESANPPIN